MELLFPRHQIGGIRLELCRAYHAPSEPEIQLAGVLRFLGPRLTISMKRAVSLLLLMLVTSCTTYPATSRIIIADPPKLSASSAQAKADEAIRREQWEEANLFLLTALDKDPSLSRQADFMKKLVDTTKRLGIDDFPQWMNGRDSNNPAQRR